MNMMLKGLLPDKLKGFNSDHFIETVLDQYRCHDLEQQKQAALLQRSDEKFVIHIKDLPVFLMAAKDQYSVLSDGNTKLFSYQTQYFDTIDKLCYREHQRGKRNRFKVRIRHYDDSGTAFVECKIKSNKGSTNKLRLTHTGGFSLASASDFLLSSVGMMPEYFQSVLHVHYYRITLMNREQNQRITLDLNMTFRNNEDSNSYSLSDAVIIEIKQNGKMTRTIFHELLRKLKYQKSDFSKYCMGCVMSGVKGIKYNRFKSNLIMLSKLRAKTKRKKESHQMNQEGERCYG